MINSLAGSCRHGLEEDADTIETKRASLADAQVFRANLGTSGAVVVELAERA